MSSTQPSSSRSPKLSSMPFAVVLMALAVLLMLVGVLPVRGGGQDAVFRSPVLILILAILGVSTFACAIRRRFSVRNIGFHLTHLSVVAIMIGAFVGALFEKKFDVQLNLGVAPLQRVQLNDQSILDLGFGLALKKFRLEKYPPNLVVFQGDTPGAEHRLVEGAEIHVADRTVTVARVVPRADVTNVEFDGAPELVIGEGPAPLARIPIEDEQPRDIDLPNGTRLSISRVYNNLPTMQMGHRFRETAFPARPGLIMHVIASNSMAILALPAGEDAQLLSPSDPAMAPEIPEMRYMFPKVIGLDIGDSDDPDAPFVAELLLDDGERHYLIEGGGRLGFCMLGGGCALTLGAAANKHYEADLIVTREGEAPVEQTLVINRPLDIDGWRLYLNSYDAKAHAHITITLRNDPGNALVVVGILGLMIGTALIFFVRKRKAS